MNYETINYAYLSGVLQSELEFLAGDDKFCNIKNHDERRQYINKIVENAKVKARKYESLVKSA